MKIRTWMGDDVGEFTRLPTLGFGKTAGALLLAGVAMLFFACNARAQVGWTDTTGAGTAVVIPGDTTTTGTDIIAVQGNGGTLTIGVAPALVTNGGADRFGNGIEVFD